MHGKLYSCSLLGNDSTNNTFVFALLILARLLGKTIRPVNVFPLHYRYYIWVDRFRNCLSGRNTLLDGMISLVWWSALTYLMTVITIKSKRPAFSLMISQRL